MFHRTLERATIATAAIISYAPAALAKSNAAIYGLVDASIMSSSNGASGSGRINALTSGVGSASRIGFRGVEDLGSEMKAVFQLEMGFDIDTGASKSFSGNYSSATAVAPGGVAGTGGFNRRAHVGLQSARWGTLILGREYTPAYYTLLESDALRLNYLGNVQALVSLTGGAERFARSSNGAFYTSPSVGGFQMRAMYGLGSESAGGTGQPPRGANVFYGVGGDYRSGALILSASYQHIQLPATGGTPLTFTGVLSREDMAVGAQYKLGPVLLAAGHFRVNAPLKGTDTWLGAGYTFGSNAVKVQLQRLRQENLGGKNRKATMLGLVYEHALSKRTALYATYGRTHNNSTGQFGVYGSDVSIAAGSAGSSPSAMALGMRHAF